jgi:hypothetical protein
VEGQLQGVASYRRGRRSLGNKPEPDYTGEDVSPMDATRDDAERIAVPSCKKS